MGGGEYPEGAGGYMIPNAGMRKKSFWGQDGQAGPSPSLLWSRPLTPSLPQLPTSRHDTITFFGADLSELIRFIIRQIPS